MVAEIISVGTELLLGNIVNINAQYLAGRLAELGFDLYYQTVVGDNTAHLKAALDVAYSRAELVILTGGLGPTKDDMTKEMLVSYFGKKLTFDPEVFQNVVKQVHAFGATEITENHRKQAMVPNDSIILINEHGTAPGCVMQQEGKIAVLLPGPPREMKPMFEQCVEQFLIKLVSKSIASVCIRLKTREQAPADRVGELPVARKLDELLDGENPTVATYAQEEGVLVRVTAAAPTHADALLMARMVAAKCCARIGEDVIKEVTEQ